MVHRAFDQNEINTIKICITLVKPIKKKERKIKLSKFTMPEE